MYVRTCMVNMAGGLGLKSDSAAEWLDCIKQVLPRRSMIDLIGKTICCR